MYKNSLVVLKPAPILLAVALLCVNAMSLQEQNTGTDPLPSWRDGQAKAAVLDFVRATTDQSSSKFVKPEERIAVFDDDGTLWPEWPRHVNEVQVVFARQRIKEMAKNHPEWKYQQPFKAILDDDDKDLSRSLTNLWDRLDLLRAANGGMTVDEFGTTVRSFLASAKHSRFKVSYSELAYQPMIELLNLLRASNFKIFIVTSAGADFLRELSESVFGVPRERIIGSTPEYEYKDTPDGGYLTRKPNVDIFNDNAAKAENIQLHIGRRPILAAGNNDGDLAMMGLTAGGKNPFLNLLIRHDDGVREYAYDEGAAKAAETVRARGWTAVSMKNDFKVVFSSKVE